MRFIRLHRLFRTAVSAPCLVALLLLVLGFGATGGVLTGAGPQSPQMEREWIVDFRKPLNALSPAALYGPDAAAAVTTDDRGLRISLPADRRDPDRDVGVELPLRIGGDFDIDVGYELLAVGEPPPEDGAGVQMMIVFDAAPAHAAKLTRLRKPRDPAEAPSRRFQHVGIKGDTFGAARIQYDPAGREQMEVHNIRAEEPRGRLKFKRTGSQLEYYCVDGGTEYHRFQSKEVGRDDVQWIRLFCFSGHRPVAVDVRFTDLVIDADRIASGGGPTGRTPARSRKYLWLALGLLLVVSVLVGWVGYSRSRHRPARVGVVSVSLLLLLAVSIWAMVKSVSHSVAGDDSFRNAVEKVRALESDTLDVHANPDLTDQDLVALRGLANLRHLNLDHTSVTDAGMKEVGRCTGILSLTMSCTGVGDAGLAELKDLKRLEDLRLNELAVTDAGLVHLQAFPQLRKLSLYRTRVTDAGMVHLKDLFFLEYLSLDQTAVTDQGLRPLEQLRNLQYLTVWESKVTDAGVRRIRSALPRLRVNK
jgi:hypothetical protein